MGRLGISIYPEKTTSKEIYDYIDKAAENGFTRIFHVYYQLKILKKI